MSGTRCHARETDELEGAPSSATSASPRPRWYATCDHTTGSITGRKGFCSGVGIVDRFSRAFRPRTFVGDATIAATASSTVVQV
jgi:hypothetical protein